MKFAIFDEIPNKKKIKNFFKFLTLYPLEKPFIKTHIDSFSFFFSLFLLR